ncbi:G patch domain and ankyrin repeat-containing protein 1 homolog [Pieris rapae]|uniref:G patch domain and ankyrin repeat-containing protein 1 homolog n=1 Tax=Pieris rapae TaxID=64459 RepID=UPI001E27E6DA|nr:G patch domain and ankyrin repeat-containing protein 1 homolog [Pieris rapae]
MYHKDYSNFVRPTIDDAAIAPSTNFPIPKLSGKEARKLYLEEVRNIEDPYKVSNYESNVPEKLLRKRNIDPSLTDQELFQSVQNNCIDVVKSTLDTFPDKIYLKDEFGWSLLMIACQANSVDIVKELIKRGIDTTVRDKAGNSAQSLVIQNKNIVLANILLMQASEDIKTKKTQVNIKKEDYQCPICSNSFFSDREKHLSSTLHNINVSKGKKIPTTYVIPESNKGFQIMLKEGWDKDRGLGPDGTGSKYPIKAVMKKDRTGLGLKKKEECSEKKSPRIVNKKFLKRQVHENKIMEIRFRREFY